MEGNFKEATAARREKQQKSKAADLSHGSKDGQLAVQARDTGGLWRERKKALP